MIVEATCLWYLEVQCSGKMFPMVIQYIEVKLSFAHNILIQISLSPNHSHPMMENTQQTMLYRVNQKITFAHLVNYKVNYDCLVNYKVKQNDIFLVSFVVYFTCPILLHLTTQKRGHNLDQCYPLILLDKVLKIGLWQIVLRLYT